MALHCLQCTGSMATRSAKRLGGAGDGGQSPPQCIACIASNATTCEAWPTKGWPTNPFSDTLKGGLGMGGKAPHSALLALQAMQPPVRPIYAKQLEMLCLDRLRLSCFQISLIQLSAQQLPYLTMRGGSLKNIAKKMMPRVPTNKNV